MSLDLKNVSSESDGNILQNSRNTDFWPILILFRVKKDPQNMAIGVPIQHTSKSSSNEPKQVGYESNGNLSQNRRKTYFWPNVGPIRGQKGPEILDPWCIIYIHWKYFWYA